MVRKAGINNWHACVDFCHVMSYVSVAVNSVEDWDKAYQKKRRTELRQWDELMKGIHARNHRTRKTDWQWEPTPYSLKTSENENLMLNQMITVARQ